MPRHDFANDRVEVAAIPLILRRAIEKKAEEIEHLESAIAQLVALGFLESPAPVPTRRVAKKPSRRVVKPVRAPKKSKKSPPKAKAQRKVAQPAGAGAAKTPAKKKARR